MQEKHEYFVPEHTLHNSIFSYNLHGSAKTIFLPKRNEYSLWALFFLLQ